MSVCPAQYLLHYMHCLLPLLTLCPSYFSSPIMSYTYTQTSHAIFCFFYLEDLYSNLCLEIVSDLMAYLLKFYPDTVSYCLFYTSILPSPLLEHMPRNSLFIRSYRQGGSDYFFRRKGDEGTLSGSQR